MMPYKSTIITSILLALVCLIQGVFANGYEALCIAALKSRGFNNDSTTKCCEEVQADLNDTEPLYITCANMSDGQLDAFTKCCPIIIHVDPKKHNKDYKGKNVKRNISERNMRNNKKRDNDQ